MNTLRRILNEPYYPTSRTVLGSLVFLIILSITILPFESSAVGQYKTIFSWLEGFILVIFTIEYILRIITAKNPIRYIFSWWGLIDGLAVLPFYLPLIGITVIPAVFAPLRILRILKFGRLGGNDSDSMQHKQAFAEKHLYIKEPNEQLVHVIQKHSLVFYLGMLSPILCGTAGWYMLLSLSGIWSTIFAITFFISMVVFFRINWTDYLHDVLVVTTHRVLVQNKELFGVWRDNALYKDLGSAVAESGTSLASIFGAGTVVLKTVTMGIVRFTNAPKYVTLVEDIMHHKRQSEQKNKLHTSI